MLQPPMRSTSWDDIVERYYESIYRFCYQLSGNAADAEEITQDVFLKALQHEKDLCDVQKIRSWLYAIARNACYDRFRKVKRLLIVRTEELKTPAVSPSFEHPLSTSLLTLIQQLPKGQREIFVLRHWHDYSTQETASLLGIHEGSVKRQLKRAVDFLKKELSADEANHG